MGKEFIVYNDAWYRLSKHGYGWTDEVTILCSVNGKQAEISLRWYNLQNGQPPSPRLEVYDDSWPTLVAHCQDALAVLATHPNGLTPSMFCRELLTLGYVDTTPRQSPYITK